MEYIEAQMKMKEMLIIEWAAKINSGWYKQRQLQKSVNGEWVEMSDEEKLASSINTMDVYVHDYINLLDKVVDTRIPAWSDPKERHAYKPNRWSVAPCSVCDKLSDDKVHNV